MAEEREEVLTLSLKRKRRHIEIDGQRFEMVDANELNFGPSLRMEALVTKLSKSKDVEPEGGDEITQALKWAIAAIVPQMSKDVSDALNDEHRMAILLAFLKAGKRGPAQAKVTPQSVAA